MYGGAVKSTGKKGKKVGKGPPIQPPPQIEPKKDEYKETKGQPEAFSEEEKKVKQVVPNGVKFWGISDSAMLEIGVSDGKEAAGRNEGAPGYVENDNFDFTEAVVAQMAADGAPYKEIIFANKVQKLTTDNDSVNSKYAELGPYPYKQLPQGGSQLLLLHDVLIMDGNQYYGFLDPETGHRDGKGVMIWQNGTRYDGCWKDDKRTGQGRDIYTDGASYEGEWLNDNIHGKGKYLYHDGAVYEGDWADDVKNGYGVTVWPSGSRYEGNYANGKWHGTGTYQWANGDSYHGEFRENKSQGKGIFKFANGNVYDGEWLNGNMHGHGDFKWSNGERYVGEHVNGLSEGHGIFEWPDGAKYDGQWLKDNRHGIGYYNDQGDKPRLSEWKDDERLRWLDEQPDA